MRRMAFLRMRFFVFSLLLLSAFTNPRHGLNRLQIENPRIEALSDDWAELERVYETNTLCREENVVVLHGRFKTTEEFIPSLHQLSFINNFQRHSIRIDNMWMEETDFFGIESEFKPVTIPPTSKIVYKTVFIPQYVGTYGTKIYFNTSMGLMPVEVMGEALPSSYGLRSWESLQVILPVGDSLEHKMRISNPGHSTMEILEVSVTSSHVGLTLPEMKKKGVWTLPAGEQAKHVFNINFVAREVGTFKTYLHISTSVQNFIVDISPTVIAVGLKFAPSEIDLGWIDDVSQVIRSITFQNLGSSVVKIDHVRMLQDTNCDVHVSYNKGLVLQGRSEKSRAMTIVHTPDSKVFAILFIFVIITSS
jgi:hypothetical protein